MTAYKSEKLGGTDASYFPLAQLGDLSRLPITVKILLEQMVRAAATGGADAKDIAALAAYPKAPQGDVSLPFRPTRILLQDFTGVPATVDLAAMRSAMARMGKDPAKIEPLIPVDLVIDHSVQADFFGSSDVYERNLEKEYERNRERYGVLRWAAQAFKTFRVVPPGAGICHQVNLERLSRVVQVRDGVAMPDTLFGADSHTTMVNGLGVLGWGVGGIEAEAAMLGQPTYMPWPIVVGVRIHGALPAGTTATDLVLTLTEKMRKHGVVNKFVEFAGDGLSSLTVQDRATVSNMCPEYGATAAFFPVDAQTLRYLRATNRGELVDLVERYTKSQGMFRVDGAPVPTFDEQMDLDLASVRPSVAGPKRPQDRVELPMVWDSFLGPKPTRGITQPGHTEGPKPINDAAQTMVAEATPKSAQVAHKSPTLGGVTDGSVVIAAITSCTNTSNPSVMIAAGLLAKNAVERGLKVKPHVKTTLAPGSRVVTRYLDKAGLTPYLEKLGYFLVGYGCTVCVAAGTPISQLNGMSRRIEDLPLLGGAAVYGPTASRTVSPSRQSARIDNGTRECVTLTLQDGRSLTVTPDHQLLRADGTWVRADALRVGEDRVVMGLEMPLDVPDDDEAGWSLRSGTFDFTMASPNERLRTLAFARLLGHLLNDGSIDSWGQSRINVGQALDREAVLNDIEIVTGKRPAGSKYDERKWAIVLPQELSQAISRLPGVPVGRRIDLPPSLPEFVLSPECPRAVIREFLGGVFGADGHAPGLHRYGHGEEDATLEQPAISHAVRPEHVAGMRLVFDQIAMLLNQCDVDVTGASTYEYPVRRSASSYPAAQDGPRVEVRMLLPDGLSFITQVGYRYCVEKQLRATAAAVYWRTIESILRQRLWMRERLLEIHEIEPALSLNAARSAAAAELTRLEAVVFPHYSTLEGADRFSRLAAPVWGFRPLHRRSAGFPSPVALLKEIGAREWFGRLQDRAVADHAKHYCVTKDATELPSFSLRVIDRRAAGEREVFDLTVEGLHAFFANGVAVHNCIGQTGPLATPEIEQEVKEHDLNVVSVLSGNRNFEGRIHPLVKSSYLASPPLVVAYALAGTVHIDLEDEPLGDGKDGKPVFLKDIWPTPEDVSKVMEASITEEMYATEYGKIFDGDKYWKTMPSPTGAMFKWDATTYVQEPPFFKDMGDPRDVDDIVGARVLVRVGDSITTDHISPAGAIPAASPAGQYLQAQGVKPVDFNQYGTRRGNHEVLIRGTFANIRLRNLLVQREGWWTKHLPSGDEMTIYDASQRYQKDGTPLILIAGKEYGSGSSRDWAAKGPLLLGVRAAIAESFERIHRSNLIGMGILPLQFMPGETPASLGLTGEETFSIRGLARLAPRTNIDVEAKRSDGTVVRFKTLARVDDPVDLDYLRNGGVLPLVLRQLAKS